MVCVILGGFRKVDLLQNCWISWVFQTNWVKVKMCRRLLKIVTDVQDLHRRPPRWCHSWGGTAEADRTWRNHPAVVWRYSSDLRKPEEAETPTEQRDLKTNHKVMDTLVSDTASQGRAVTKWNQLQGVKQTKKTWALETVQEKFSLMSRGWSLMSLTFRFSSSKDVCSWWSTFDSWPPHCNPFMSPSEHLFHVWFPGGVPHSDLHLWPPLFNQVIVESSLCRRPLQWCSHHTLMQLVKMLSMMQLYKLLRIFPQPPQEVQALSCSLDQLGEMMLLHVSLPAR